MIRRELINKRFRTRDTSPPVYIYTLAEAGHNRSYNVKWTNASGEEQTSPYAAQDAHECIDRGDWIILEDSESLFGPGDRIRIAFHTPLILEFSEGETRSIELASDSFEFRNDSREGVVIYSNKDVSEVLLDGRTESKPVWTGCLQLATPEFKEDGLQLDNYTPLVVSELKIGDYIYEEYNGPDASSYISIVGKGLSSKLMSVAFINVTSNMANLSSYGTINGDKLKVLRYATEEERNWLDVCLKAKKFIPREEASKGLKPKEEVVKEELIPAKGYSLTEFDKALASIPWMEKDDAADIFKGVKQYLEKLRKVEEAELPF